MMISLAEVVSSFERHLAPPLASADGLARMREVASFLPAHVTDALILECRFGAEPDAPDLSFVCSRRPRRGAGILAGRRSELDLSGDLLAHPDWQTLRSFARIWTSDDKHPMAAIALIFLEFDVYRKTGGQLPVPNVFFRPPRELARALPVVEALIGHFVRPPLSAAATQRVVEAIAAAPASTDLMIGLMLPRDPGLVRVSIQGLTAAGCGDYLRRAGWPGDSEAVRRQIDRVVPAGEMIAVNLDVGSTVQPKVDFEYALGGPREYRQRHRQFLSRLVDEGLMRTDERQALSSWRGWDLDRSCHELWQSVRVRWVNHVKVVYPPEQPPHAKVYLGYGLLPLPS